MNEYLSLAAGWPLALTLLVSWPLVLALVSFNRLVRPGLLLALGLPVLLLATLSSIQGVLSTEALPLLLSLGGWQAPLGIQWQLDSAATWGLALVNLVAALAALSAWLMGPSLGGSNYFWPLWWLLWGGMNALVVSADLFNLYVTLELVTLTAVGLVAQSRNDPKGQAAMDYLLASLLASLLYLLGVALIYAQTGSLDLTLISERLEDAALARVAAVCMTLGLLLKAAVVPLHFWLPEAHSRAQAPVSVMLSSVVVALAIYLLWRLWFGPFQTLIDSASLFFSLLASLCLLWGGVQALIQTRLKRVLAYSTLSQLGFALMLLTLAPEALTPAWSGLAEQGSLIFLLAHGLAKAALFMVAGVLTLHLMTDRLEKLQASAFDLPVAWIAFVLASISLLGAPPTAGFAGKWLLLQAALQQQDLWTVMLLLIGTLMTAIYLFRVMQIAWKPLADKAQAPQKPVWRVHALSWLALVTALSSWAVGIGVLSYPSLSAFSPWVLDQWGQALLLPVVVIWPLAILFTRLWGGNLQLQVLLLLGGLLNLALLFAADLLTFYVLFALLSFLGWWMVIQPRTPAARAAGRLYLGMSLIGELAFFLSLGLLGGHALSFTELATHPLPVSGLLALGLALAIKSGVLGVHIWLPVAHPVAPTAASAVLSGLMIKAGLLGGLRILPAQAGLETAGFALLVVGFLAAFYAGGRGLAQTHPKTLLAWSSISQMGLMTALLGGSLLLEGASKELALLSLVLLITTHALAKAGLFLSVGLFALLDAAGRRQLLLGVGLLGLILAGAPLTGGMLVKLSLESSLTGLDIPSVLVLGSSLLTSLLLGRFLWLLSAQPVDQPPSISTHWLGFWWLLVVLAATYAWFWLGFSSTPEVVEWRGRLLESWAWLKKALPPILAAIFLMLWWRYRRHPQPARLSSFPAAHWALPKGKRLQAWEHALHAWPAVGLLLAWCAAVLSLLLAYSLFN